MPFFLESLYGGTSRPQNRIFVDKMEQAVTVWMFNGVKALNENVKTF